MDENTYEAEKNRRESYRAGLRSGRIKERPDDNPNWTQTADVDLRNPPAAIYPSDAESSRAQKQGYVDFIKQMMITKKYEPEFREFYLPSLGDDLPWINLQDPLFTLILHQFNNFRHKEYANNINEIKKVILRIKEIAAVVSAQFLNNITINLADLLSRNALAAFLKPIYDLFEAYLRGNRELEYLFKEKDGILVCGLWFQLHKHLVEHGFSIEEVKKFINERERANTNPYAREAFIYSPDWRIMDTLLTEEDSRPDIRQFRENFTLAKQEVADHLFRGDQERSLALAMSTLGKEPAASHLTQILGMHELRNMVYGDPRLAMVQSKIGYTGPKSYSRHSP